MKYRVDFVKEVVYGIGSYILFTLYFVDLKNDPSRFDPPGVNFNAKLIGIDDVSNARGDKMCQESMYRLKIAIKQSGQHKQKIIVNVSLDGIRIIDVRTQVGSPELFKEFKLSFLQLVPICNFLEKNNEWLFVILQKKQ